jgi:hypothetical protein
MKAAMPMTATTVSNAIIGTPPSKRPAAGGEHAAGLGRRWLGLGTPSSAWHRFVASGWPAQRNPRIQVTGAADAQPVTFGGRSA